SMVHCNSKRHSFLVVTLLVLSAAGGLSQEPQNNQRSSRPLQMLVLGDSISWGQGLKSENKTWHHIKVWLQKSTSRTVVERIEARRRRILEQISHNHNLLFQ